MSSKWPAVTVTVDAAAAATPRSRCLSVWSLGKTAGGNEVVGAVVGALNREKRLPE